MPYRSFAIGRHKIELLYGMTDIRALLAYNIKKRREKLGISQAKLAERVDTSTNYIAQIEQRYKFPSSEMLERLAAALEIDSPELFSSAPFPVEAIQQFQEGIKADIEKRIERLIKSNK
jgi:transcriptional regulator with XRE-family HTH domain